MVGLLVCSVWVWAIVIDKTVLYTRARHAMDRFETAFWSGQSLEELYRSLSSKPNHSMAALFVAAMREWKRSFEGSPQKSFAGLQMRIEKVMQRHHRARSRTARAPAAGSGHRRLGRPLRRPVRHGLGHHDQSFQSIAASKNTSLAVVAPGIAEALFATAIGLVAAIPAVIVYNKFTAEVNKQAPRLEGFADEFSAILSRQIEERQHYGCTGGRERRPAAGRRQGCWPTST